MRILKLVGQKLLSYLITKFLSLMYREISSGKEESINNKIVGVKGSIRKKRGSLVRLQYTSILLALEGGGECKVIFLL